MARALVDQLASARGRFVSTAARPLAFVFLVLGILAVATGWIFASSPGSSPDDDFHLVSTWCPHPIESTGCGTTTIDGDLYAIAPLTASRAMCEAFRPDKSHACIKDYSDDTYPSYRYNDGQYPYGFYQFHHLFAGHNVEHSVWIMRAINVGIAMVLIGAVCALSPRDVRRATALAALVAWTPMGLYFIASNNPSSWAITGVFTYGAALNGALNAQGWRRWTLLGVGTLASLLCYGSRGDAAFYVFVVSLGILILAATRTRLPEIGTATVLSIIGIWCMFATGQSHNITQTDSSVTRHERLEIAIRNIRYLPEYFAGFIGLNSGPGWRDTPLPGYTTILALLVLGAVFFYGARSMNPRKALAAFVVFGAMAGIPLVIATPSTFSNIGGYHPRYTLPLLGTWLIIWLTSRHKNASLSKSQLTMFVLFLSVAEAVAMHTTIARYVHGLENIRLIGWIAPGNLNGDIRWWWADMPLSPMALWGLASLGYVLALTSAIYLLRHRQVEAPASTAPTEEEETA
jgi:hypothetical protein